MLVHAGAKLVPVRRIGALWRDHRGEAVVLATTAGATIATTCSKGCWPASAWPS
ncbi:hypothetical protein J2S46_000980 [Kitasatospora herbaricolor]|nr:hypothetical protein [Kitasatospora herbaricolor]